MILIFLSFIIISSALQGLGKIIDFFSGITGAEISEKILTGIIAVSTIWTVTAFFIPLNIYIEIPTVALGLFFFFRYRLYHEWSQFLKQNGLLFTIISLIILFCGSFYPYILDHFGYYVPSVKWLSEYGLVKGIANLDLTLGQMSVWHIFQAGFSNFSDPFLRINVIILLIYTIYIIEKKSWIQLTFLPVMFLFSQSPSPDLPVIIFSLIILNEIMSGNKNILYLFTFSVFVFTIKPTMVWLPVFSLLYSVIIVKSNVKSLIPGILLMFLFFSKNIWTFGYPVFPLPLGDLGMYWKPNPQILKISSEYAIQKTYDMQYSYNEIQQFSSTEYIKNWFFLDGIKSVINIMFTISLIGIIIFSFIQKSRIIYLIVISLIIKSILILLFSAQYRFFLDVFFVIFFIIFNFVDKKKSIFAFSLISLGVILFLSFPSFIGERLPSYKMASFMGKFQKKQIFKPSAYEYTPYSSFKVGNLKFNVSENYPFNFGTPLPAISQGYLQDDVKAGIFPQLIHNNNIKKGFLWKKITPQEKTEAERIITILTPPDPHNK